MTRHPLRLLASVALIAGCAGRSAAPAPAGPALSGPSETWVQSEPGERHLRNIRQLTFGGNNAEAYFSSSGTQLIFQRQEKVDAGCDQQYIMNTDGSGETPRTTTPAFWTAFQLSRNSQASTVQPLVSSLG